MRISGLKKAGSRSGVLCKDVIVLIIYRHVVTNKVFGFAAFYILIGSDTYNISVQLCRSCSIQKDMEPKQKDMMLF